MVDSIEKFLQINVHHPVLPFSYVLFRLGHRIQRASLRTKAVAALGECRLENRLQYLMESLLDESIHHRGYAERSHPAIGLGNVHSAHCPWQIPIFQQCRLHT